MLQFYNSKLDNQQNHPKDEIQESEQSIEDGIKKALDKKMRAKRARAEHHLNGLQKLGHYYPRIRSPKY